MMRLPTAKGWFALGFIVLAGWLILRGLWSLGRSARSTNTPVAEEAARPQLAQPEVAESSYQLLGAAEDALRAENFEEAKAFAAQFLRSHGRSQDTLRAHSIIRSADSG